MKNSAENIASKMIEDKRLKVAEGVIKVKIIELLMDKKFLNEITNKVNSTDPFKNKKLTQDELSKAIMNVIK